MSTPLITVVIPTCARPQYLPRAVESALDCGVAAIEVIIVPNGPDQSWRQSLAPWVDDARVRISPIAESHANAARNHGIALATGQYLQLLDDDDYLYADGFQAKLQLLIQAKADICSAPIDAVDTLDTVMKIVRQPETSDFVAAMMSPKRMCQPSAHLFAREFIQGILWDTNLPFGQDIHWMLKVAGTREVNWVNTHTPAAAWLQHQHQRISSSSTINQHRRIIAQAILDLVDVLEAQNRLTKERREIAAFALWECVHRALYASPKHWICVAGKARALAPESAPDYPLYQTTWFRQLRLSPLLMEMLLTPKRAAISACLWFNRKTRKRPKRR